LAWTIEFIPNAEKALTKLEKTTQKQIYNFLRKIADSPRSTGQALIGPKYTTNLWRYRVGDYRVIASIEDKVLRVLVLRIGHRREIYRKELKK
jgi:mRNA interferase RelE/StbE